MPSGRGSSRYGAPGFVQHGVGHADVGHAVHDGRRAGAPDECLRANAGSSEGLDAFAFRFEGGEPVGKRIRPSPSAAS